MLRPYNFRVDYGKLKGDARYRICSVQNPVISWSILSNGVLLPGKEYNELNEFEKVYSQKKLGGQEIASFQGEYHIVIESKNQILWDSGWIRTYEQSTRYAGEKLPVGQKINITVEIKDIYGNLSEPGYDYFYMGQVEKWDTKWIAASNDKKRQAVYFMKNFKLERQPEDAYLLISGLGYHSVDINGCKIDKSLMDPAYSDYSRTCYYALMPEIESVLKCGDNKICCCVGDGWRRLDSDFIKAASGNRKIPFDGLPQLTAMLFVMFDGEWFKIAETDESWSWSHGPIVSNNLYDGTIYDARVNLTDPKKVAIVDSPGGKMIAQSLEPIRQKAYYSPISISNIAPDVYIVDFGQNIAGYTKIVIPKNQKFGQKIEIKYAELLKEDGDLFTEPLRDAKCTDVYYCSGIEYSDKIEITSESVNKERYSDTYKNNCKDKYRETWEPEFTYRGFRYVKISGYGDILTKNDIEAIAFYTDIDKENTFFRCGNSLINQIHINTVMSERSNLHSILSDCPQRNERMAWMNDATVRFEETPYNFDIGRIFPKVVRDIIDSQKDESRITCTSPYIVGGRPADPVCSSFLIAGISALMHTGNVEIIAEAYYNFKKWEDYLLSRSDDYIVNYSYYGDWASPADCCESMEDAKSAITPGIFMSTGYSYYNCIQLAKFAQILGKNDDVEHYTKTAEQIKDAFLKKWFDEKTGKMATGSQACQVFPLWLGIVPQQHIKKVVQVLREDLNTRGYRITTGNLCTRYILDVLTENGYVDDAWEIMTNEKYPSIGYMIQNEATTIWERFELKKDPSMNSHNHPMYGAVDYWLYAYICGIKPIVPGWKEFSVKPYFPNKLLSAQCAVDTPMGQIDIRWVRQYGKLQLHFNVPFGCIAHLDLKGYQQKFFGGSHQLCLDL